MLGCNATSETNVPEMKNHSQTFTQNISENEDLEILMTVVPIVVPILFTFIIIIGFIGNLLVILVVIFNKTMRNTTNILIFNLAVSKIVRLLRSVQVVQCIIYITGLRQALLSLEAAIYIRKVNPFII